MISPLYLRSFSPPPANRREILRYAGVREEDASLSPLVDQCLKESQNVFTCRVAYRFLSLEVQGDVCKTDLSSFRSLALAQTLAGCGNVMIFAATVGLGIDRLIARFSRLSPSKALLFQAIGTQRVEALCDVFVHTLSKETGIVLTPRFSPGYGDLPLSVQRDIFSLFDSNKIGISLGESMVMSPSKSVTAFAGLTEPKNFHSLL